MSERINSEIPRRKRGVMIVKDFEEKRGVSGGMDERVGMERHVPGGDVGRHWVAVVIVDRYENDFTAHSFY
eukprot:scaffold192128_cov21-Cyclotella_meneghiniana.AAC.1